MAVEIGVFRLIREARYTFSMFLQNFHPVNQIQTKFGMNILLDPRNKPAEEFFIFLKIQDGRRRSKVQNRPNFTPQITFWLIIWIWFIRFGPNLAGRYYSTQGTSLCKNFLPIAKSKMAAAAAITANYEIGHNLKSIQFRDPIFFPRPMFSRVRNARKLSYHLHSTITATTPKSKMAAAAFTANYEIGHNLGLGKSHFGLAFGSRSSDLDKI